MPKTKSPTIKAIEKAEYERWIAACEIYQCEDCRRCNLGEVPFIFCPVCGSVNISKVSDKLPF